MLQQVLHSGQHLYRIDLSDVHLVLLQKYHQNHKYIQLSLQYCLQSRIDALSLYHLRSQRYNYNLF